MSYGMRENHSPAAHKPITTFQKGRERGFNQRDHRGFAMVPFLSKGQGNDFLCKTHLDVLGKCYLSGFLCCWQSFRSTYRHKYSFQTLRIAHDSLYRNHMGFVDNCWMSNSLRTKTAGHSSYNRILPLNASWFFWFEL